MNAIDMSIGKFFFLDLKKSWANQNSVHKIMKMKYQLKKLKISYFNFSVINFKKYQKWTKHHISLYLHIFGTLKITEELFSEHERLLSEKEFLQTLNNPPTFKTLSSNGISKEFNNYFGIT